MTNVHFGWIAPAIGVPESEGQPIVIAESRNGVLDAVNRHFESVWMPDHLYGFDRPDDAFLECWTSLTWLAATLPDVLVGALVMANNYRSPALVAHMGKTLQAFSGGRMVLGYGAGWREPEYRAHGYPFGTPAERIGQLDEGLRIIRSMWTEPRTTFEGRYYAVHDVICEPKPKPVPPILIGGGGERLMLPLVARHADWWHVDGDVATYGHKLEVLRRCCDEIGRDVGAIVKTVSFELPLPEDGAASRRLVDRFEPYVELGVTHIILDCGVVTDPGLVERLAQDVLAHFRS